MVLQNLVKFFLFCIESSACGLVVAISQTLEKLLNVKNASQSGRSLRSISHSFFLSFSFFFLIELPILSITSYMLLLPSATFFFANVSR
jgi:hypothetical protein